jgi:negative regulator of replication initiation
MPVATTRLPQEISDYLAARAKVTGESVADLLRQAVEQWVKGQDAEELVRVQRELNREREKAMEELIKVHKRIDQHPPAEPKKDKATRPAAHA